MNALRDQAAQLPLAPGVYLYKDAAGKIIYVGKAKSLRARVRSYFNEDRLAEAKTGTLISEAREVDYILVDNEKEALALENNLIKQYQPRYNVLLRDDKTYPYIKLTSERFRAVRLVVDTGIHDLGWTRQQAVDYFTAHAPEISLAEIDRYISWPAQALSYKMGELRIRSLRARAERELGTKFDIRDFNDAVIRDGRLPLDLLTEQIDQFIAQKLR